MNKCEKCTNKVLTTLMIVCVLLSVAILCILSYDRFLRKKDELKCNCPAPIINDGPKERKITVAKGEENYVLDFDDIEDRLLKNANNNHKKVILSSCDCKGIGYDNIESMNCDNKELSVDSIGEVINKLYNAKKVEWVPTSKICADNTFLVEDSNFFMFEADDKSIILAGIDQDGYAFHFDGEDVRDFLKGLK